MNLVVISGNLGRDPELKTTPKGESVAEFSIANTKRWTTAAGEKKERTSWVRCFCWGKRGESLHKYARKGAIVLVRGELVEETWTNKEGKQSTKTRVQVEDWEFMGPKRENVPEGQPERKNEPSKATVETAKVERESDDVPF